MLNIDIDIIAKDPAGHDDLRFVFTDLREGIFDSYYFLLAIEQDDEMNLHKAVATLISFWIEKIRASKTDEEIHLPIDLSDQYTGCLRLRKNKDKVQIAYGHSLIEGWAINPLYPESYYRSVTDFTQTSEKEIIIGEEELLASLNNVVNKLNNDR